MQLDRFHSCFNLLDSDANGDCDVDEFLTIIGEAPSDFSRDIFHIFDDDHDGKMDFVEFVAACSKICCSDYESLTRFAFRVADVDSSGKLEQNELEQVVRIVYGNDHDADDLKSMGKEHHNLDSSKAASDVLGMLSKDHGNMLTVEDFCFHAPRKFPQLVEPIFQLQRKLKSKVIGEHFWKARSAALREKFDEVLAQTNVDKATEGDWWGLYAKKFASDADIENAKKKRKKYTKQKKHSWRPNQPSGYHNAVVPLRDKGKVRSADLEV